jgi:hypothetical protein
MRAKNSSSPNGQPMLSAARTREQLKIRFKGKQVHKAREALVALAPWGPVGEIRARARPAPVPRAGDETRAHRIERYVAQCGREVILVHDDRAETTLPEMTDAPAPRMDYAGIAALHARECAPQPVGIGRHQDEVGVIGHQAPSPHFDTGGATMPPEIEVEFVIVAEEGA